MLNSKAHKKGATSKYLLAANLGENSLKQPYRLGLARGSLVMAPSMVATSAIWELATHPLIDWD